MIIEPTHTTVSYRCPDCGAAVLSAVNPFNFAGDLMKLKCDCGKSNMDISKGNNDEVLLNVPCMMCGKSHRFTVSKSLFFGKDLFTFSCPYTGVLLSAIGEMNQVKAEMAKSELELLDFMEESGISMDALKNGESEEQLLPDPQIRDIVLFVIHDLDAEGKITCKCDKSDNDRDYNAEIQNDGILVTCKKCHASRLIPTDSSLAAYAFLNADELRLE